jgi:hypothetical protein
MSLFLTHSVSNCLFFLSNSLFVLKSILPFVVLSICVLVCPPIFVFSLCLSICLSFWPSICLKALLSYCLSFYLYLCLFVRLASCPSSLICVFFLSVTLFVYLSGHPFFSQPSYFVRLSICTYVSLSSCLNAYLCLFSLT